MYKKIRKIPIIGALFRIANAYVYEGDVVGNMQVAPWDMWKNRIGKKLFYALSLNLLLTFINYIFSIDKWSAADTILSVFPSLLGFGIGVFALLFILPNSVYKLLMEEKKSGRSRFGPEIIPVDMGYPLLVFAVVLLWAGVNKGLDIAFFNFISGWLFFYGVAMTFELISFLFNMSILLTRIQSKK